MPEVEHAETQTDWFIDETSLVPQTATATGSRPPSVAGEEMVNEQPLRRDRPMGGMALPVLAVASVLAALVIGIAIGRAAAGAGSNTGTSTRPAAAAYCADLKALTRDLAAAEGDAGKTGGPNAYAAAEVRDAGPIYDDASSSSDPAAARRLALALTLDGQARQQPGIDAGLLARIEGDTAAAVKAAPSC